MFGDHPEADAELRHGYGCSWYSDHGPYYSGLQGAWLVIGLPCIALSLASLLSAGTCWLRPNGRSANGGDITNDGVSTASAHYGPLIDVLDGRPIDADSDVHRWVVRGAGGAIVYGVLLAALGLFIVLHANNEAEFTLLVDACAALAMCASKLAVVLCVIAVHRHLSPLSRQVAKHWTLVLAVSKGIMAACSLVLAIVYLVLAIQRVDTNRGDKTRRMQEDVIEPTDDHNDHGATPEEQAQICAVGFFMVWSFLVSMISQSLASFALFRIYANAVRVSCNPRVFHNIVDCWWCILVVCTCGVGVALWLGSAIFVFPGLDISPLRMMGLFYFSAAGSQILAGCAMIGCNKSIRDYWGVRAWQANVVAGSTPQATVVGSTDSSRVAQGQPVNNNSVHPGPEGKGPGCAAGERAAPAPVFGMRQREGAPENYGTVELTHSSKDDACEHVVRSMYAHLSDGAARSERIIACNLKSVYVPEEDLEHLLRVYQSEQMAELRAKSKSEDGARRVLRFFRNDCSSVAAGSNLVGCPAKR